MSLSLSKVHAWNVESPTYALHYIYYTFGSKDIHAYKAELLILLAPNVKAD